MRKLGKQLLAVSMALCLTVGLLPAPAFAERTAAASLKEDAAATEDAAGPRDPAGSGDTAGSEDSADSGDSAGSEDPADPGDTAGSENPADSEDAAGSEDSTDTGDTAGSEDAAGTEDSAGAEDDANSEDAAGTSPVPEPPGNPERPPEGSGGVIDLTKPLNRMPIPVPGQEGLYYYIDLTSKPVSVVECDNGVINLDIPADIEGNVLGAIKRLACPTLETVTLPDTITRIHSYAFNSCPKLTSIRLPSRLTAIENGVFGGCESLTSIEIPATVTSIGDFAFTACSGLKHIDIPSGVTSIGESAFDSCTSLTSVTIPSRVTRLGRDAFSGCSGLTSVSLPDGITSIGPYAFSRCSNLTQIQLPSGLQGTLEGTFWRCTQLKSIAIPAGVTSIGPDAFSGCTALTSIVIPASVTSIGGGRYENGMFYIDGGAFSGCTALTSVAIPAGVTSIGNAAFYNCELLETVTFAAGSNLVSIGGYAFHGCKTLPALSIPGGVTFLGESAFADCTALKSITIPSGVTSMGERLFSGCGSLESARVLSSAALPEWMFCDCRALKSVVLAKGIPSIGTKAFINCEKLTGVSIPSGVTSIGDSAFEGCETLRSVTLPNTLTSIGNDAFHHCWKLTGVKLPSSVKRIGSQAFSHCYSLTSLALPKGLTNEGLGQGAFSGSGLRSIELPKGITEIPAEAFSGCSSMRSIVFPNNLTSIGERAFANANLKVIALPKNVTSIGSGAFDIVGEASVYYGGSKSDREKIAIGANNTKFTNADWLYNAYNAASDVIAANPGSAYETSLNNFTIIVRENMRAPDSALSDRYRLSSGATIVYGNQTATTGTNGAYRAIQQGDDTSYIISKEGFATVTRTEKQLQADPNVYLEPARRGIPTVTAVWLNGTDIRHNALWIDTLSGTPVELKADVVWNGCDPSTTSIRLVQGSRGFAFTPAGYMTMNPKQDFDLQEPLYLQPGGASAATKPLHLHSASVTPKRLKGMKFDLTDSMKFTIPEAVPIVGNLEIDLGLTSPLPFTCEIEEDGVIYVAIGLKQGAEFSDGEWTPKSFVNSLEEAKSSWGNLRNFKKTLGNHLTQPKSNFSKDYNLAVMGYAKGYIDKDGEITWLDSGTLVDFSGELEKSFPFSVGSIPAHFGVELEARILATLSLQIQEAARKFLPKGTMNAAVTLSGKLGVGVPKVLAVDGVVSADLENDWEFLKSGDITYKGSLSLSAHGRIEMLTGKIESESIPLKDWSWPDEGNSRSAKAPMAAEPLPTFSMEDFQPKSPGELTDHSAFLANDAPAPMLAAAEAEGEAPPVQDAYFAANVYSLAGPQLAVFSDGNLLAVWVGLDDSRAIYDRPRLYYSLRQGATWSEPAPVNAGGEFLEAEPVLSIVDDTAYLAWYGANGTTSGELTDLAPKLEIFSAVLSRSGEAPSWSVTRLTENDTADFSPTLSSGSGGVAVVWQSNSANDLFCEKGDTSVEGRQYTEEGWVPLSESHSYPNAGTVLSLAVDMDGNEPRIAWCSKENDVCSVYLDGALQGEGNGVLFNGGDLYWYQAGKLMENGQETGASLGSDRFRILNNTLLYVDKNDQSGGNDLCSTLYAHYFDPDTGLWSNAVALSDGSASVTGFSATYIDSGLQVLFAAREVLVEGTEAITENTTSIFGATNLVLLGKEPACDLSIGEPWYPQDSYVPNSTMLFTLDVTNHGSIATGYVVSVTPGDSGGTAAQTVISPQRLLPGCTEEIDIPYLQGEVLESQLTFTVTPLLDIEDSNPENNTVSARLSFEDVAVENVGSGVTEAGSYQVYADVVNRGNSPRSGLTISLYRATAAADSQDLTGRELVESVSVDTLASLDSHAVSFDVPAPEGQTFYVVTVSGVDADLESNSANNSGFTVCALQEDVPISLHSREERQVTLVLDPSTVPAGKVIVAAYNESGRLDTLGFATISQGSQQVQVAMAASIPEGDSLTAMVVDGDWKPLLKRVTLSSGY